MTATPAARDGAAHVLRGKISLLLPELVDASQRLLRDPRIGDRYPEFLFTSHCIIRASVPVMDAARTRALSLPADDPVRAPLASYLSEHIPEELHHDEWLLDDLDTIGVDRQAVLERPPSPTVAQLVGAQYYWIAHYHPIAVLGYIAVLEGYPPSDELIEELMQRTGYGAEAFRTLRLHGDLDVDHRSEFDALVDRLPLSRRQSTVIGLSALSTVDLYTRAIEELLSTAPRREREH
jgi:hypothetical protein